MADFRLPYDAADGTALSSTISGEAHIEVLLARQTAYQGAHLYGFPPLLEWIVRDEDTHCVELPAPKRTTTPRVYRSAASIRCELERVDAQLAAIGAGGPMDRGRQPVALRAQQSSRPRGAHSTRANGS
ncbi:hypothetical protein [Nocardia sp. NRRL S-836]|uniref:hypothetical protein n=1 Tax=Nocardia sp. NRRL S-836 TaxID=1519492 RepID=UPI0006AE7CBD|nr:hypothetical protein [Nocardia sp. NRRL S-836]KOV84718.1 hypothetical protein ADL03_15730 [Nocardia sp. NRRL S-836]